MYLVFDLSITAGFLSSKHSVNSQIADQTVACNSFIICINLQTKGFLTMWLIVNNKSAH